MEIASCVVRLCNFRAPVIVRTSSAVLFTRRGRKDGCLRVRIYPSIEGSCNCARDHRSRSIMRRSPRSSDEIVAFHQSSSQLSIAFSDRSCRLCSIYPLTFNGELSLRLVVGTGESEAEKGERNLTAEGPRSTLELWASFTDFFFFINHTKNDQRRRRVLHVASIANSSLFFLSFENGRPNFVQRKPIGNKCKEK